MNKEIKEELANLFAMLVIAGVILVSFVGWATE